MNRRVPLQAVLVLALALPSLLAIEPLDNETTLRVNPAVGVPGGVVALVIRTYAPRPVSQGQMCIRARRRGRADLAAPVIEPFVDLLGVEVFSSENDATFDARLDVIGGPQEIQLTFESPSSTINDTEGPTAVVFVRLSRDVTPGESWDVELDLDGSFVLDEYGRSIGIQPRAGELRVRKPGSGHPIEAQGDEVAAGQPARLGIGTFEPLPLSSGRLVFHWDPRIAAGPPVITSNPRHGEAIFTADTTVAGRATIEFTSPGGTFNRVPGNVFHIYLPTVPTVPLGASSRLFIDPESSYLVSAGGEELALVFEDGELLLGTELAFGDDFETGDVREWSP